MHSKNLVPEPLHASAMSKKQGPLLANIECLPDAATEHLFEVAKAAKNKFGADESGGALHLCAPVRDGERIQTK